MTNLNNEITDGDLEKVSGGLDCKTAILIAQINNLTATALSALAIR